jgi:Pyruvate/2-oxoacid:ferredoxin oxidoreductase delta subunit
MKVSGGAINGRARVIPDGTNSETFRVQRIFTAIGAEAEKLWQVPAGENKKMLNLSHCTLAVKDLPMVYGGDLTNRLKSVADAIASGKQAAMVLDILFQKGWDAIEARLAFARVGSGPGLSMEIYTGGERSGRNPHVVSFGEINIDYFQVSPRIVPPKRSPDERIKSFSEIERTFSEDPAIQEASRCFNCGICNGCDNCRVFCPEVAVLLEDTRRINLDYCKGCGICVVECPRNAMGLEEEQK